ncbi:MAG: AMP-binding protein, partial [Sulfurovum sp.]|uniref:AMP-binding protein n=1 Tax=Sulfurovum sp. TaxID=1969726 RepID=UPI003C7779EB
MEKAFIELPELTLNTLFDYSVKTYKNRPVVQFVGGEPVRYKQLAQNVENIQEMLHAYGIKAGDRVALYSENMPNWSAVYFAVTTMGAVIVPVLPDFHTSEALHIATHAECKAAFISQKLFQTMLDESQPPSMNLLVITDTLNILEKLSTPSKVDKAIKKSGAQFNKAMEKLGKHKKVEQETVIREEDLASIIYTSG